MIFFRPQQGFSLLETLIAVTILTIGVLGPLTAASNGLMAATYAKNQITAIHLAEEAIEVARNIRDTSSLGGTWPPPYTGASGCVSADCDANMMQTPPQIQQCSTFSGGCLLNYNKRLGLYNHESVSSENVPSIFTRVLRVNSVNANEFAVTVTVSWTTGIYHRNFTAHENLTNWR